MKAAVVLCVAVQILLCGLMPVGAEPAYEPHKIYTIGGDENFPPYEFVIEVDGLKAYRGFNVDIVKAVALHTGIEIEFFPMKWADAMAALDSGQLDAIQGMKYNEQRALKYDFVEYLTSNLAIFVRKETVLFDLGSLRGRKIAVQEGDIAFQMLHREEIYDLVIVVNQEEAFERLLTGQVVAVVGNKLAGQYILQKNGQVEQVKMASLDIAPGRYGVAVRKGDIRTLLLMQKGIAEIKRNGTYDKIYQKWFGEPVDYPTAYYRDRMFMAISTATVLLFILALMFFLSYVLRQEVHKRTAEIRAINQELLERNEYIRKEDAYKEKVLNSGYNGIVTLNEQGYIQFINDYAYKYLNCLDAVGLHYSGTAFNDFFPAEGLAGIVKDNEKTSGEKSIQGYCMEYTITGLAGAGQFDGLVLEFRDVTLERQLREQVVRKDKMEALGSLVAGIAHEIRTPLTSIKTFAELLPAKYDNPDFRKKISLYVPQEVERVDAMVNNLLDYARPRKPSIKPVAVHSLVQEVLILCGGRLKKAQVRTKVQIPSEIHVLCDKQQVQQVLINVLLNAVDALSQTQHPQIVIKCTHISEEVILVIEDNGCGMETQVQSRIFDPFFTTKPTGTGLGLAISYQFILENNGQIWVESSPDAGTQVFIRLQNGNTGGCDVQTAYS